MGVSFSEKPFTPATGGENPETTFCGQIDAELAGQAVVVAGRLVSVRYLVTRDGRPFASAILEDFSGQVEVMVWPKVYAAGEDLWQEGNEVVVRGKVRVKDERVQVNCDEAVRYQPPEAKKAASRAPAPQPAPEPPPPPAPPRRLIINMQQTEDEEGDITRLNRVLAALKAFPGRDSVQLNVLNGGAAIPLDWPGLRTGLCPELERQLVELVGEDGLKVEKI